MATTLPNLEVVQPAVSGDTNTWGALLNANWLKVDNIFVDEGTGTSVGMQVGSGKTLDASAGITKVNTPTEDEHASTKGYVDSPTVVRGANLVKSGPISGADAAPTFRALVSDDVPSLDGAKITTGTVPDATTATTAAGLLVSDETLSYVTNKFVFSKDAYAPDFCATSDRKLKQDIRPLQSALKLIRDVQVHRFEWKDSGASGIGVIAQELQQVIPEAVEEGDPMSVHYNYLFSVLVQAVQELMEFTTDIAEKVNGSSE